MEPSDATITANLIGHQGRCFDIRLNPKDSNVLLSASEDGTAKLWSINKRSCSHTFLHNKESEVLRAAFVGGDVICTAGSDGKALIWNPNASSKQTTAPSATLIHGNETSQIYVCEPWINCDGDSLTQSSALLTAADSQVYFWDIETQQTNAIWEFTPSSDNSEGFGGDGRNPNREVYVFDAKWRPNSIHEAAVALSDSTLRILDTRQKEPVMTLSLEIEELAAAGVKLGHATSVNWNRDGSICSVSFGSGIIALIDISAGECLTLTRAHNAPCYGSLFDENAGTKFSCLSWSADSTISFWSYLPSAIGEDVTVHHTILVKDMSILSCCLHPATGNIICGGGSKSAGGRGSNALFMGTPIHLIANPARQ